MRPSTKILLVMKLTTFLLLAVCLQISAKGVSQSITLSEKNAPLKKVLREVSRQSGISIVYDEGLLAKTNPVTVEAKGASVQEVMEACLRNQPVFFTMEGQRMILQSMPENNWAVADTSITVKGMVTDEKGMPIPGATIRVKGGSQGTATDATGHFTLKAPSGTGSLQVTVVGYNNQTVAITGGLLSVKMALAETALNETVVVGYGVQKKSVVTGAISSVRASDLESQPVTRIESALQGRTSGVTVAQSSGQPGSGSTVRVRGITTFNNNDPLWVVDGVVVDNGGIGYLNQYDIESIEVLKDAASQAIYGARAAAGVILVTTKKGKAGKMQVNYNGYYGTSQPARKLKLLDATQYATLMNEANAAAGYALPFTDPRSLGKGTDWQGEIFNNSAVRQNHEVSISGGNDRSTFFSSFGYLDQEGIVASPISHYKRFNVRVNSQHKLASWLTFAENIGYAYDRANGIGNTNSEFGGPLSSAINLDPTTPAVETDPAKASSGQYVNTGVRVNAKGQPYGISDLVQNEMSNPLAYIINNEGNYNWSHNIVGNTYLEAEPIKGLRLRSTVGAKIAFWGGESFTPIYYYNTTNKNARTAFNRNMSNGFNWNVENTVSYTRAFNDHNVTVLVGQGAYMDGRSKSISNTFQDLQVDNFWDASEKFKVAQTSRSTDGGEGTDHRIASLFGRLNYNFKEKYLLEGVIRRDGSSRFGPNNKYGTFPSVSAGWVASKESFFPKQQVVDFLKVRGGYGMVGNDNIGDFGYLSTIGSGRNYTFGTSDVSSIGYSPDAPSNPDLKWESTAQTNVGFEASLFRNFTLSFDWYKKVTKGILQNPRIPAYVGAISNPPANVADMQNTGEELELGYHAKVGELSIGLNGNVSYTQNKITYVGRGLTYLDGGVSFQSSSYPITRKAVGHPIDEFFGFVTEGIFQTQADVDAYTGKNGKIQPDAKPGDFRYKDVNGDGMIDGNDRDFIGNPTPTWTYGFNVNLAYKGFDLGLFGQGASGNKIFQGLRRLDLSNANWQTKALSRWTGPGTSNDYPRLTMKDDNHNFTNPSGFYLEDGAYMRLKTVQLGYTLPGSISRKAGISRARIYLMSENLFTFTKYTGYDPEIGGGTMSIDRGIYPQARSFLLGLNVTFQ